MKRLQYYANIWWIGINQRGRDMHCKECGQIIDSDSRFCRHCGSPQITNPANTSKARVPPAADIPQTISHAPPGHLKGGMPTWVKVTVGGIALLLVISLFSPTSNNPSADAAPEDAMMAADAAAADAMNQSEIASPATEAVEPQNWIYQSDEDKVRAATTFYATTTSANAIHQSSPYDGETRMEIIVRQSPSSGTDVMLTINQGQFMCPSYQGCRGTVRFDDGTAQQVSFNGPADNSTTTIFVQGAKGFLAKMKKSKRLVIEKTLYQAGNPQFEFTVSGLKWDH